MSGLGKAAFEISLQRVSFVANERYRLILKHSDKEYQFLLRTIEAQNGIRAIQDTEEFFRFLHEKECLGIAKHVFQVLWQIRGGTMPTFPLMLLETVEFEALTLHELIMS